MPTTCYWVEPTGRKRSLLRVHAQCGHTTRLDFDEEEIDWDDARWPESCPECGEIIDYSEDSDTLRVLGRTEVMRRSDTGEEVTMDELSPGAMWNADWMPGAKNTQDGRYLVVRLPNGFDWAMDARASNCDRPTEDHDCWCRHGEPPVMTVDKNPEPGRSTCSAGGGSIWSGQGTDHDWHGFLTNGELVSV